VASRRILAVEEARRRRSAKALLTSTLTTWVAIFALVISTFQAYLSYRSLLTSQRAWIVGAAAVWDQAPQPGKSPSAILKFVNTGKTPALNVKFGAWVILGPPGSSLAYGEGRRAGSVVGPGIEGFVSTLNTSRLSEHDLNLIADGKLIFYVAGVVYYEDIFSRRHETTMCFQSQLGTNVLHACFGNNEVS
jgi:hypothetical protein